MTRDVQIDGMGGTRLGRYLCHGCERFFWTTAFTDAPVMWCPYCGQEAAGGEDD